MRTKWCKGQFVATRCVFCAKVVRLVVCIVVVQNAEIYTIKLGKKKGNFPIKFVKKVGKKIFAEYCKRLLYVL